MQRRKTILVVVVAAAVCALVPVVVIGFQELRVFEQIEALAARNNGTVELVSCFPSLAVSVSFPSDDLRRHCPPDDMLPVLRELKSFPAVRHLDVEDVEPDEFATIVEFANLRSLGMEGVSIPDEQWSDLDRLSDLRSLRLWHTRITPAVAEAIGKLKNLRSLDFFFDPPRGPSNLQFLAGLHELRSFRYFQRTLGNPLNEDDLAALGGLPKLKRLEIINTPLADGALAGLTGAQSLEELEISVAPINTDDLIPIAALPKLRELNLETTGLTSQALATLKSSRSIRTLRVADNPIDAAALAALSSMSNLKQITVSYSQQADAKRLLPGVDVR